MENSTGLLFCAKADYTTKAGSYNLALNFQATANPAYPKIQDFTRAMCQEQASSSATTVVDVRDDNDYQVRYINGNCWMVQNLRYVGDTGSASGTMIMKSSTSNISADKIKTYHSLANFDSSYSGHCDAINGYDYSCIKNSSSDAYGVWYNYAATITGSSKK